MLAFVLAAGTITVAGNVDADPPDQSVGEVAGLSMGRPAPLLPPAPVVDLDAAAADYAAQVERWNTDAAVEYVAAAAVRAAEAHQAAVRAEQRRRAAETHRAAATTTSAVAAGSVWDRLAQCESEGNWHINTGNGYYGGLQFNLSTWRAYGGTGYPHEHSRATQIAVAERLRAARGFQPWPACSIKLGLR